MRQKRVSYRRCFQGPQDPHPTLGATGTAGAAAEPPEPRFPGLRGSGFTSNFHSQEAKVRPVLPRWFSGKESACSAGHPG